jgi:hypothetical protein
MLFVQSADAIGQRLEFKAVGITVSPAPTASGTQTITLVNPLGNRWIDNLSTCNQLLQTGYAACDAEHVIEGTWNVGLDFVEPNTIIPAPIVMGSGQKITLNSNYTPNNLGRPNLGGDWITDDGTQVIIAQGSATVARFNGVGVITPPKTVATLGVCNSSTEGARSAVRDATSPTFLSTLTGGGTVHSPAYCNGTAWVAG